MIKNNRLSTKHHNDRITTSEKTVWEYKIIYIITESGNNSV